MPDALEDIPYGTILSCYRTRIQKKQTSQTRFGFSKIKRSIVVTRVRINVRINEGID